MKSHALKYFTDTHLTLLGLIIFFIFFIGLCYFVFKVRSNDDYKRISRLPIDDEVYHGR